MGKPCCSPKNVNIILMPQSTNWLGGGAGLEMVVISVSPVVPVEEWCGVLLEELHWMQEGNSYTGKDISRLHGTHVMT